MKPATPAFAALYAASIGIPRVAAAEATAMNRPRRGAGRRSSAGTATRARFSTPPRLTSSRAASRSRGTCQAGAPPAMTPATAIAASSPPQRRSASPTAAASASGSRVSATYPTTSPSAGRAVSTTRSRSAGVPRGYCSAGSSAQRSTAMTRHPPAARAATVAAPTPRAAPVTRAARGDGVPLGASVLLLTVPSGRDGGGTGAVTAPAPASRRPPWQAGRRGGR